MKILFVFIFSAIFAFGIFAASPKNSSTPADRASAKKNPKQWKLIKAEEFNTPGKKLPNSQLWGYEEGLVRNKELQSYQAKSIKNSFVENGKLVIMAYHEQIQNENPSTDSNHWRSRLFSDYSSASINTENKFSIQYGRVEVSAKLPRGRGAWPAIWMMGDDRTRIGWPKCGEIDIMEYVSPNPNTLWGTCHWFSELKKDKHASKGSILKLPPEAFLDTFNLYAIEWTPQKIDFFFNDSCYFTLDISDKEGEMKVFHKPHYLLINLAVGGWAATPAPEDFPIRYEVDYVRFFKSREK